MSKARDLATVASRSADIKPGTTAFFAMSLPPSGWLKANGANVSRTLYADLFAAIGTTFGAGDGSTTFALPDLRGEFPRGLDDGRGVDTGRTIGSAQVGTRITNGVTGVNSAARAMPLVTGQEEQSAQNVGTNTSTEPAASTGFTFTTRPRNVALLACIKT